jgi:hypothetical protein
LSRFLRDPGFMAMKRKATKAVIALEARQAPAVAPVAPAMAAAAVVAALAAAAAAVAVTGSARRQLKKPRVRPGLFFWLGVATVARYLKNIPGLAGLLRAGERTSEAAGVMHGQVASLTATPAAKGEPPRIDVQDRPEALMGSDGMAVKVVAGTGVEPATYGL